MKVEISEEQIKDAVAFFEKETKYMGIGERYDIGAHNGIVGILDILGITIEGIND